MMCFLERSIVPEDAEPPLPPQAAQRSAVTVTRAEFGCSMDYGLHHIRLSIILRIHGPRIVHRARNSSFLVHILHLTPNAIMSKLSEPLKALIGAAHAKPNTLPAPKHIKSVYERIANEASSKQVGLPAWLTASVSLLYIIDFKPSYDANTARQAAATFTMNSPDSLLELYSLANSPKHKKNESHGVYTAELMREIGLKCIGLNGVSGKTPFHILISLTCNTGTKNNQLPRSLLRRPANGYPKGTFQATSTKVTHTQTYRRHCLTRQLAVGPDLPSVHRQTDGQTRSIASRSTSLHY